jgi:hypothetical protein
MSGEMMDCLKVEGKEPVAKDALTILVMVGARIGRHFFRRVVGIGSRSPCLLGADWMWCVISSTVAGWKDARLAGGDGGSGVCGDEVDGGIADRSWKILSAKKDEDCAVAVGSVDELDGNGLDGLRWSMELIVYHSLRGSVWLILMRLEWYSRFCSQKGAVVKVCGFAE